MHLTLETNLFDTGDERADNERSLYIWRFHATSKSRESHAVRHIGVQQVSRQHSIVRSHRVFEAVWPQQRCFVLQNTQGYFQQR